MKHLIFLSIFLTLSFSCGGSCIECHPRLQPLMQDKEHLVLNQCITCHDKPVEHGACGQDCFSCHDKAKLYADASVKEHQAIKACYMCHKDNSDLVMQSTKSNVSSDDRQKPLVDIFK